MHGEHQSIGYKVVTVCRNIVQGCTQVFTSVLITGHEAMQPFTILYYSFNVTAITVEIYQRQG
ncbi:MAG: hypothetical protein D8M52_10450 [Chlorobi bacterium]|nr:hypothetical protein [Chlorobiota bacterium]